MGGVKVLRKVASRRMILDPHLVDEANVAFQALVGLPLTDMWRYLSYQRFEFGEQKPTVDRKGNAITKADWALTVICEWRIEGPAGFVLHDEHFGPAPERHDEHAHPFYDLFETHPPVVEAAVVHLDGSIRILLTQEYSLSIRPLPQDWDVMDEWRLMPPQGDPRGHLVLDRGHLGWSG